MLKVELHAHTDLDPLDYIAHSTRQLIDRAADLGYAALAVTLHNRYYDPAADWDYARARHVVLMAGVERSIDNRHVLLINFPAACADVATYDDIRALKRRYPRGLVIAPHAFYPIPTALRSMTERHADVFDAVEVNSMFTVWFNFNPAAIRWAGAHAKPLVGSTDLHLIEQLGTTYTLVDAEPDPDAICDAIRAGRVELRSDALPTLRAGWIFTRMTWAGVVGRLRRLLTGRR